MKRKASVVIVERLPICGQALARLLEGLGADVVGRAKTFATGLRYLKTLTPNFLVMDRDGGYGYMDVVEAVHTVSAISPKTRIVLLFSRVDEFEIRRACYAGVSGCLLKTDSVRSLRMALGHVLMGSAVCSAGIRKRFPTALPFEDAQGDHANGVAKLTTRELQVLPYIARGFSLSETADRMGISRRTVDGHKTSLMKKLDVHDRVMLTRFAIRERLIPVWGD